MESVPYPGASIFNKSYVAVCVIISFVALQVMTLLQCCLHYNLQFPIVTTNGHILHIGPQSFYRRMQVMIYRLVTRGSIEERMMQMTKKKMVLEHLVVGRLKNQQVLNQVM